MKKKLRFFVSALICAALLLFPTVSNALEPENRTEYRGIDVSNYQGDIDFKRVKAAGIEAVYIKSSQGSNIVDAYFEDHYKKAKEAELKIGFYHYVTARTVSQTEYQARFFVSTISEKEFEGKLAMDFEDLTGLSTAEINRIALAFAKEVERVSGKEVVVYSDAYNASNVFDKSLTKYSLWVAEYGASTPSDSVIWDKWAGWQYSDTGRISGINGYVDLDRYTRAMFADDKTSVKKPDTTKSDKETVVYTVKRGNTLTGIARLYHTTVARIVSENHISNRNRIYVGEKLRITIYDDDRQNTSKETYTYIVKPGNTLSEIARKHGTTVSAIVQENKIKNPNLIYPGQILRITK